MLILKITRVLSMETKFAKNSGQTYKTWKLLCDAPYFDTKTGVHASSKVIYASSSSDFEPRNTDGTNFVFISQNKSKQIWINGMAV